MLYPNNSKPLYERLKDVIKQKIDSGEYKPDTRLPGERQLIDMYQVSRITVRQAIGDLVNEGLLYRIHGKGTFVSSVKIERAVARYIGVAEELLLSGYEVDIEILKSGLITADAEVYKALKIPDENKLFMIQRRVFANKQILFVDYSYLPSFMADLFKNVDLTQDLLFTILEKSGYKISYGEEWIGAGRPSKEEAAYLECKPGSPVLIIKRNTYLENDIPINYGVIVYRSDRYEYYVKLKRNNPELK